MRRALTLAAGAVLALGLLSGTGAATGAPSAPAVRVMVAGTWCCPNYPDKDQAAKLSSEIGVDVPVGEGVGTGCQPVRGGTDEDLCPSPPVQCANESPDGAVLTGCKPASVGESGTPRSVSQR